MSKLQELHQMAIHIAAAFEQDGWEYSVEGGGFRALERRLENKRIGLSVVRWGSPHAFPDWIVFESGNAIGIRIPSIIEEPFEFLVAKLLKKAGRNSDEGLNECGDSQEAITLRRSIFERLHPIEPKAP